MKKGLRDQGLGLTVLFFLLSIEPLSLSPSFAAESAGTAGAAFLAVPVSVRSMGMGDTGVALALGANSASVNPAGLTRSRKREMSFSYQDTLADTALAYAGSVMPLKYRGFSELGGATLFGNALYFSKGTIEVNSLNSNGSLSASSSRNAGYDLAVTVGYAEHFFRGNSSLPFLENGVHSIGMAMKAVHSVLLETYEAQAVAFDVGYLAEFRSFSIGFSAANMGSKIKFIDAGDSLPVVLRAGAAIQRRLSLFDLRLAFDLVHQEETLRQRIGAEIGLASGITLRGGWRVEPESFRGGPSAGFGLDMERFFTEYAFNWFADLRDTHRLLIGFRFGSTLR